MARDNLVNFKKVTLGIYHGAAMLGTDLRRMACFFRGPPATLPATGATPEAAPEAVPEAAPEAATATASEVAAEAGPSRGFARTSRHSELCDALCETSGALGVVLDVRRMSKAACCVPRHPAGARGGLLSEPLPHALKTWALLQEARAFLSRSAAVDAAIADALSARLTTVARAVAALAAVQPRVEGKSSGGASDGGDSGDSGAVGGGSDGESSSGGEAGEAGDALAAALCGVVGCGLPPSSAAYAFVRGVLIARGASKALRVTAELRGLVRLSALLLEASEAVAHALGEAGAALHARTAERAARLQRLEERAKELRHVEAERNGLLGRLKIDESAVYALVRWYCREAAWR